MNCRFIFRVACIILLWSNVAQAAPLFSQRSDVHQFIREMVEQHGFSESQLNTVFNKVALQPQIIVSMEQPYEKKTWDTYKQLFLTPERLNKGLAFWKENQTILTKAEHHYGIPASVIIAVIGIETIYGKNQGNYRVIDALSTLAFNYPKRAPFFKKELAQYLLLCREHKISPLEYHGSYAGAMGKPQFMPSSYRTYATDFTGNSKKDLMNNNEAVIASVANYLYQHGWRSNQGIAQPARIVGKKFKHINTNYKNAFYNPKQLAAAGIKPAIDALNLPSKMGLIALTTTTGSEFWLAYPNFYVITRYNTSPQYALAVYLLSKMLTESNAQKLLEHSKQG